MNRLSARTLAYQGDLDHFKQQNSSIELRQLYRTHRASSEGHEVRQGIWLAVVTYLLFAGTDILLVPDVSVHTIVARLVLGITALAVFEYLLFKRKGRDILEYVCAAAVVFGYAGWLLFAIKTSHVENFSYYMVFGSIFMMGVNLFFAFGFVLSIISSTFILICFFISLFNFSTSWQYTICLGTFYVSCFVFTSYINWNLNVERYNVFLNALEARKRQEEAADRGQALLRLSRTDPLTNLNNRRAMDEILRSYWRSREDFGRNFAIALIDIDFFKRFNDYYGHMRGDHCLTVVATALNDAISQFGGAIGRYGGEEFIALLPVERHDQIAAFSEAARRTVESLALPHRGRRDRFSIVTASIGVSLTRSGSDMKLEKVISEADRALYLAKSNGRNCVRIFDQADREESDLSDRITEILKDTLNLNLLSLAYQPIQNVTSGKFNAVEALMRFRMPDGAEISPLFFIPLAEKTGTILDLQYWVIRTVCKEILTAHDSLSVSVNISPIELKTPGFPAAVAGILHSFAITGERLIFEITERLDIEQESEILVCIGELKQLGIRIWLDDFGTGFAGLSWLRLIEFDTVKIDQSFLRDCATVRGKMMLYDIASLIRNRGAKILVEGVETAQQLALLQEIGIDEAQGFHIGVPKPAGFLFPTVHAPRQGQARNAPRLTPSL